MEAELSRAGVASPPLSLLPLPHTAGASPKRAGTDSQERKVGKRIPGALQTKLDEKELFARRGRDLGRSLLDVL